MIKLFAVVFLLFSAQQYSGNAQITGPPPSPAPFIAAKHAPPPAKTPVPPRSPEVPQPSPSKSPVPSPTPEVSRPVPASSPESSPSISPAQSPAISPAPPTRSIGVPAPSPSRASSPPTPVTSPSPASSPPVPTPANSPEAEAPAPPAGVPSSSATPSVSPDVLPSSSSPPVSSAPESAQGPVADENASSSNSVYGVAVVLTGYAIWAVLAIGPF